MERNKLYLVFGHKLSRSILIISNTLVRDSNK